MFEGKNVMVKKEYSKSFKNED